MANNNTLCGFVGRQKFNLTKDGVKLAEKLKNPKVMKYILSDFKKEKDKKKKKGPLNITYVLGQGLSTDCPKEACDLLFKREFGDDSVFNFGCKCFPEGYVPSSAKITDPELIDAFDDETKALYKGDIVKFRGDFFGERKCYEGLRDFFQKSKDDLVIVQGAELINFKEPTRHREADFVIVNLTRKYIMNIECKNYLGPWEGKRKDPVIKAKEQLEDNKANMENWLSNDIQEEWTYLSAVYCKDIHPDLKDHCQSCSQCTTFIIQGEEELKAKLLKIEKMVPRLGFMTKADRDDFKTFLKYLLFLMPRKALPIGANYTKQFREAVEKAGDIENIKNIAFPTNAQRLLKENYMKAIMFGPWGSGKTLWMTDKAIKLAKKGHKVAFAIFVKHKIKTKPMLFIDLQHKLKNYENIEVVLIPLNYQKINNLVDITNDAKYFLGDEFPDNLGGFKKQVKDEFIEFITSRDFAWLTLINSSFKDLHDEDDFKSTVEKWKPIGFEIIEMETPMRMPSRLAEGLKKHLNPNDFYSHGLFVNSKLPPNITEGSDVTIINEDLSADRMISECFKHIRHKADNIGVLFIVGGVETSWIESLLNCQCKNKIKPILMDYLLEKEERKPPIFHLNDYSSGEQAVLNWMINAEKSQDAFVQHELAKGTERPVVVVFDGSQRSKEFISRSNGIAVLCKMDWKLALSILAGVILGDRSHHCESILDRNSSRPQINFDIDLILASKGLKRSKFLENGQTYRKGVANPILTVILDQIQMDSEWRKENLDVSKLLTLVFKSLEKKEIKWNSNLLTDCEWIQKMEEDSIFYRFKPMIEEYEFLLLDLLSQTLKRKIKLIPFNDIEKIFQPSSIPDSSSRDFFIYGTNNLKKFNIFFSVTKLQ